MGGQPSRLFDRFERSKRNETQSETGIETQFNKRLIQSAHQFDRKTHAEAEIPERVTRSSSVYASSSSPDLLRPFGSLSPFDLPRADLPPVTRSFEEHICSFPEEAIVLFVVTEESLLYTKYRKKRFIEGYPHQYSQGGRNYIQLPAVVKKNPKGPLVCSGSISRDEASLFAKQREGVTVVPLRSTPFGILASEDKADREKVLWTDLQNGHVEFWAEDCSVNPYINLNKSIPRPRNMAALYSTYRSLLQSTDRDSLGSHRVALNYYRNKAKVQQYIIQDLETQLQAFTSPDPDERQRAVDIRWIVNMVEEEVNSDDAASFYDFVKSSCDTAFKRALIFFMPFATSLFSLTLVNAIASRFFAVFPLISSIFRLLFNIPMQATEKMTTYVRRKTMVTIDYFLASQRVANPSNLCSWAMVKTMSMMGMGASRAQMQSQVDRRFGTHPTHAERKLKSLISDSASERRNYLSRFQSLSVALDNFQKWVVLKFQTAGVSTNQLEGTIRYIRQNWMFVLPPNTILTNTRTGIDYVVVSCRSYGEFGPSHVEVKMHPRDQIENTTTANLPSVDWRIKDVPGLSPQPDVTFFRQKVPFPQHYPKHATPLDRWLFGSSVPSSELPSDAVAATTSEPVAQTGAPTNPLIALATECDEQVEAAPPVPPDLRSYGSESDDDISILSDDSFTCPDLDIPDDVSLDSFADSTMATNEADRHIWDESTVPDSDLVARVEDEFDDVLRHSMAFCFFFQYLSHPKSIAVLQDLLPTPAGDSPSGAGSGGENENDSTPQDATMSRPEAHEMDDETAGSEEKSTDDGESVVASKNGDTEMSTTSDTDDAATAERSDSRDGNGGDPNNVEEETATDLRDYSEDFDALMQFLNKRRPHLRRARHFQQRFTRHMFPDSINETPVFVPPLSRHRETNREGAAMVMQELLYELGLIDVDEATGRLSLCDDAPFRRIYQYGDALTNDNFRFFPEWLDNRTCDPKHAERADVLKAAIAQVQELPGDLHIGMHMLVLIFKFFYGGLLQPVQHVLGWKNVKKDVVTSYQNCKKLCLITLGELWRYAIFLWLLYVFEGGGWLDVAAGVTISDEHAHFIAEDRIKFTDLHNLPDTEALLVLSHSFLAYVHSLRESKDEVVRFVLSFMELASDYKLFIHSVRHGDALTVERIIVSWLPVWREGGKSRYFNLTLRMTEALYGLLTPAELEEVRRNRFVRLHKSKGCIAADDFCEVLNYLVKRLSPSRSIDALANKTGGLLLFRQCKLAESGIYAGDDEAYVTPKSTTLPSAWHARRQVLALLVAGEVLIPNPGRGKLKRDFLWNAITNEMLEGRAKSKVVESKSPLSKAEEALKSLWDKSKKQPDEGNVKAVDLPESDSESDSESDDEETGQHGLGADDAASGEQSDAGGAEDNKKLLAEAEQLAKKLAKAKKAKIYGNGRSAIDGIKSVGMRKMRDGGVLERRRKKAAHMSTRSRMHKAARKEREVEEKREAAALSRLSQSSEGPREVPEWLAEAWKLMAEPRL